MADDRALGRCLVTLLLPRAGGSLERAAARAIDLRLAGLLLDGARSTGRPLAGELQASLVRAARREAADDARVARETADVLDALAPLAPAPWKGRAIAEKAWPRPSLRPPGDLDLLVEPAALAEATSRLLALGYRPAPSETLARWRPPPTGVELLPPPSRRVAVDLHARPFRTVGGRIDGSELLRRARPTTIAGRPARALDEADLLHLLLVHAAKHGASSLKWLLDLHALADRTDGATWETALSRAAAAGTSRAAWAAARAVAELPDGRVPEGILARSAPPRRWRPLLRRLVSVENALRAEVPARWERYALEVALEPSLVARVRRGAGMAERLLTIARAVSSR